MSQRNVGQRSRFAFESLEGRQMLSASPSEAERLAAAGFVPVTWNGQETFAKAGEWILNVGGTAAGATDPVGLVNALANNLGGNGAVRATRRIGRVGQVLVKAAASVKFTELRAAMAQLPGYRYLEPNFLFRAEQTPNDPKYTDGTLWGFNSADDQDIDAPEAWNATTGSQGGIVGVIDTGVDVTHPDLYQNIWINQAEIPAAARDAITAGAGWDVYGDNQITFIDLNDPRNEGAGKITDHNGNGRIDGKDLLYTTANGGWADGLDSTAAADPNTYVDDLIGWNFITETNDPSDDQGHGTHVAGTIAARGNNSLGVVGVNWRAQVMGLKFLDASGYGTSADAIEALDYTAALNHAGVNIGVTNNSYGGEPWARSFYDAIKRSGDEGMLFVAASGNGDWLNRALNNDTTPHYPSSYGEDGRTFDDPSTTAVEALPSLENVIAVTATDINDNATSFGNYGLRSVDLAAPGANIYSLAIGGGYAYNSGTSMAAPHVAGAAALAWSFNPGASHLDVKRAILDGADRIASQTGRSSTGGRLNLSGMLDHMPAAAAPATPGGLTAAPASSTRVDLTWNDVNGETGYTIQRRTGAEEFADLVTLAANTTGYSDGTVVADTAYEYRIRSSNGAGSSAHSEPVAVTTPAYVVPAAPTGLTATSDGTTSAVSLAWTDNATNETGFRVRRSTSPTFATYTDVIVTDGAGATTGTINYTDAGLTAGTTYYYRVSAYNTSADSAASNDASATTTASAAALGGGLRGRYYDTSSFGSLKLTRIDNNTGAGRVSGTTGVAFNWGTSSPSTSGKTKIGADTFSVRWQGQVQAASDETYTFYVKADDGIRLWVDGKLVINVWRSNTSTWASAPIALTNGRKVDIQLDYYEGSGGANVELSWSTKSIARQVIPANRLYAYQTDPAPLKTTITSDIGTHISSLPASASTASVFSGTRIAGAHGDRVADELLGLNDDDAAA